MKADWKKVYGPPFEPAKQRQRERQRELVDYKCVMFPPPVFNLKSETVTMLMDRETAELWRREYPEAMLRYYRQRKKKPS